MAMQILFTAISLVALAGCFLAVTRTDRTLERCKDSEENALRVANGVLEDRHRLTSAERDVAALRRELRKLSGKFYASLVELEPEPEPDADDSQLQPCENWLNAKRDGPMSEAARCECGYCLVERAKRVALRGALVPKSVGGQAELAKLNAGKP